MSTRAFKDYVLNAVRLSGPEVEAIKYGFPLKSDSKSEQTIWQDKLQFLGLNPARPLNSLARKVMAEGAD